MQSAAVLLFVVIYLIPPAALVVADFACSKPYPIDMPSRSLRRSSSPRKNVATLWIFRGRVCGKAGRPVGTLSLRAILQTGAAIRTLTGHEGKDKGLIYLYPPATLQ